MGKYFDLTIAQATGLFLIIYFLCLFGLLIFLTFSSFYLVIFNFSILKSIKKSISLTKKTYLQLTLLGLSLIIFSFISNYASKITEIIPEIVNFILIPYIFIVITRIVLKHDI
jgi:hypothetical protein